MAFSKEILDEILKDYHGPEGIMKQLTKALVERTMEAELTDHLGYEKHDQGEKTIGNRHQQRPENGRGADDYRSPP
jgi:transposase-like protein